MLACEACEDVTRLDAVVNESKLRGLAEDLNAYIKGKVNSNELRMPRVSQFLRKLRLGFLDKELLAHDAATNWDEEPFVKTCIEPDSTSPQITLTIACVFCFSFEVPYGLELETEEA